MVIKKYIIFAVAVCFGFSQEFGKNKVQYEQFEWDYIQSQHFDIYFYDGGKPIAEFAASAAEKACQQISDRINFKLNRRISLILYNSHNDFQQTNITLSYLEEGVGGFTEFYKNRIVLPFEGSYSQFRHVLHHEMVHALLNEMMYGGTLQSAIANRIFFQLPLWMNEGLAEFLSLGWDEHSDLVIRDMTTYSRFPKIPELSGYFAYKGGQSVWRFIVQEYGCEKIAEILHNARKYRNVEKSFKRSLGVNLYDLSEDWHAWLREQHWSDAIQRQNVAEIGSKITDHKKWGNFFNIAPAISPDGSMIAFLSDKHEHSDIFLYSVADDRIVRKLVSGGKTAHLEELKWLTPGISWSPDNHRICFAAKSGSQDAIIVKNIQTGKMKRFVLDLDGIFSTAWSPMGEKIAIVGIKNGQSDIYSFHLETEELINLTNDVASEFEPSWSADGLVIVYAYENLTDDISETNSIGFVRDISTVDVETGTKSLLLTAEGDENFPKFSTDGKNLLYTSDQSGISNLYKFNIAQKTSEPLTNLDGGVFQPSWSRDSNQFVFATFQDGGWDIVRVTDVLSLPTQEEIPITIFRKEDNAGLKLQKSVADKIGSPNLDRVDENPYSDYIFGHDFSVTKDSSQATDEIQSFDENGQWIVKKYKTKFTLDYADAYASYGPRFGFQGSNVFVLSDILGNYQMYLSAELFLNLKNSDYSFVFMNFKNRINFGIGFWHSAHFFLDPPYITRYSQTGIEALVSLPFSKFSRIEVGLNRIAITDDQFVYELSEESLIGTRTVSANPLRLSLIADQVSWGHTGPKDGRRMKFSLVNFPKIAIGDLAFQTFRFDFRQYFSFFREYSFAARLSGAFSQGENAQTFFLGGQSNWINYRFSEDPNYGDVEELYFSDIVTPLRGANYYAQAGNRCFLMNAELRFPFVHFLYLGFPTNILFQNIRGAIFADIGSAWNSENLVLNSSLWKSENEILQGYGTGVRIFLGYFLLKIDAAWTPENSTWSKPKYYFSVGADF